MFFRPADASAGECAEILSLRLSLNTPVVAVEELPVGPARAGIALHLPADPDAHGPLRLVIAVRAVRGGEVAVYASEEPIRAKDDPWLAIDAALSFAEGMGFLFDEDAVATRGERGHEEARSLWRELLSSEPRGGGAEPDEILLDQPAIPEEPKVDDRLVLSRFRRVAAGERPGAPLPTRAAGSDAAPADPSARLLSRF